jgi:hypothetical protein
MDKIVEERQKLEERLEEQKALIRDDMKDIKHAARPMQVLKAVAGEIWSDVRSDATPAKTLKMAAMMLPGRLRNQPAVFLALNYVLPFVVRHYPQLAKKLGIRTPDKAAVIGALKNRVHSLRERIQRARERSAEARTALPYSPNTDQWYV